MAPRQCEVCRAAESKYKCPSCLVPYCSLACFKKHKENPCTKTLPSIAETTITVFPERSCQVDESSWVVHEDQFCSVVESKEIRDLLKDQELRKLVHRIDCSKDPEDELDKAMKSQIFCDFADKILSVVGPQNQAL